MLPWISSNSCPLNLKLLSRDNHGKAFIQGRNYMTRVWVEPRSCDQNSRKNDALGHSADHISSFNAIEKGYATKFREKWPFAPLVIRGSP